MEQITITRGLAELKLLDARITKEIQQSSFVSLFQKRNNKELRTNKTKEEFEVSSKASLQSIKDLINRRNKIKSEILKSNAVTIVKIGKEEMSVVEAIDKKSSIEYDKLLLAKLKNENVTINNQIASHTAQLNNQVDSMLQQNLGADKKASKDDWDQIAKPFIEANEMNKLDAIKIDSLITKLDSDIDSFIAEVDFVLSESNSKTMIEIS